MRELSATIAGNEPVGGGLARLALAAPSLSAARPGQWIALRHAGALAVLAQPYPLVETWPGGASLLYREDQAASSWLAALRTDATVAVLGPWGQPLAVHALARHVVLLGSGAGFIDLLCLAHALVDDGVAVVALHDAPAAAELVPPLLLPPAVEYHVATADGSAGVAGTALDALAPLLPWADALYAALDPAEYPTLRDLVHRHRLRVRRGFATVLARAPLACFAGACDGCAVPLRGDRYGLLCRDGPAFDLLDLA